MLVTACPSTAVMMSPSGPPLVGSPPCSPAWAAGPFGTTAVISTPWVTGAFSCPARVASSVSPWMGIQGETLDATLAGQLKAPVTQGVLITAVVPNGPAAQAGLQGGDPTSGGPLGDIITAVDGQAVTSITDLQTQLQSKQIGNQVTLTVARGTQTLSLKVTLAQRPNQLPGGQQLPNQAPTDPGVTP